MTDQTAPTDWIDGHPQLEAIAAAVWEQCERGGNSTVFDDPRNIAVAAYAAVLPAPAENEALWNELHRRDTETDQPHATDQTALRDRIAEAIYAHYHPSHSVPLDGTGMGSSYRETADAVLAVLPAPADQAAGVCICGHTKQQHFEDVCTTEITGCDCGDFLVPSAAREVIDRWREAAMRKTADQAAMQRVRVVLETEAVVGRSALEYRGLIASALMADETQQPEGRSSCGCPSEDAVEHQFGGEDCDCIPFTRQRGAPRYCQPGDTVDMISGWEIGSACPHHRYAIEPKPAAVQQPKEGRP